MTGPLLLVEDHPADVLLIRRAFKKAAIDIPIRAVGDGEEAIAYLSGAGVYADRDEYPLPVLVLLDLKLPKKSGFEVLQWLREQPDLRRLPVTVLTSSKESSDIDRAYEFGANSYLVKPPAFDNLQELMRRLGLFWAVNEQPRVSS